MHTADSYIESLRARHLELWVDGARLEPAAIPDHPRVRPAINAVAATYALAHDPAHAALATAHSDLIDAPVNRFTHLFREPADLIRKVELQRLLGRITGTCFQRCVGLDALNALFLATWEAGPEHHARFVAWMRGVQARDETLNGAMTDPKGDRRKRPGEQPDAFVRVVARRQDGIVLRGAKLHQTGAANAHQVVIMPGQALRPGEEDFAVAAALPVDSPGLLMVLGRQPSDERKGTPDAGNATYCGQECVVVLDDVFVPHERVFLDGQIGACGALLEAFAGYHRASYGGCKPGNLDVLIGASAQLAAWQGTSKAPHVRDKLVEMVHLTETIHGLGLAASARCAAHQAGVWQVDAVLANVCKHNVTRLPYEVVRLAEDLAGGLVSTLPSLADLDHPRLGPFLRRAVGSPERARMLRLVEFMTSGAGSVPLRIECMHGAGSPQAQRVQIARQSNLAEKKELARRLAGVDGCQV
jgi:4-hydroxybutyryl-CoA dehydratase/vinylacetyl-CoA-Delta-isomerase